MKKADMKVNPSHDVAELQQMLEAIGIARFVGRINSGIIPSREGYAAVEQYVSHATHRPFLTRLSNLLLSRQDRFSHR